MSAISGEELPIKNIFDDKFEYHIPVYQRPYAWQEEHAETLFDNLFDFYSETNSDDYFLGSIVLMKKDKKDDYAEVTDGQQRLITLTILLASISAYLHGYNQEYCYQFIWRGYNPSKTPPDPVPRIFIRPKDQIFFEDNIQKKFTDDAKLTELKDFVNDLNVIESESCANIRANCRVFLNKIEEKFSDSNGKVDEDELLKFLNFMLNHCYLVVVITFAKDTAFRVFKVLNTTGLDLTSADIIKSDLIGSLAISKQDAYADKWEDLEIDATRQGFNDVFTHLRMVYVKKKAQDSLIDEFEKFVKPNISSAEYFIDKVLTPYTKRYVEIKNKSYPNTNNSAKVDEINFLLMWLNKIDNYDWIAPTLKFFVDKHNDVDYILWFTKKIERLAAFMHITAFNVNQRIERYAKIISEMENNSAHNLTSPLKEIELTDAEKTELKNALDGEIFRLTARRRNYVILRLDSFVASGSTPNYSPRTLSIEHVLPQTVNPGSGWNNFWTEKEKNFWLHRIANLVPLTRQKNSEAQNFDFYTKKTKYFTGANGTISYPLTSQVVHENIWTPAVVEARQKKLLDVFKLNWEL